MTSAKCKIVADLIRVGKPITVERADEIGVSPIYKALLVELGLMPRKGSDNHLSAQIAELRVENERLKTEHAQMMEAARG